MHYLLLIYRDEARWAQLPELTKRQVTMDSDEFMRQLARDGYFCAATCLHPTATATTVRSRNARLAIVDGPCCDQEESLAGYLLVECRELGEAIAMAGRMPIQKIGASIEVRPVNARLE